MSFRCAWGQDANPRQRQQPRAVYITGNRDRQNLSCLKRLKSPEHFKPISFTFLTLLLLFFLIILAGPKTGILAYIDPSPHLEYAQGCTVLEAPSSPGSGASFICAVAGVSHTPAHSRSYLQTGLRLPDEEI